MATSATTPFLRLLTLLTLAFSVPTLSIAHDGFEPRLRQHHRHRDVVQVRGIVAQPTAAPIVGMIRRKAADNSTNLSSSQPSTSSTQLSSSTTVSVNSTSTIVSTSSTIPPTSTACAANYTGATTTISGTGTLPRTTVSGFVKHSGNRLTLGGKTYRIAGPNVYWLGLDENMGSPRAPSYPSKQRIREAMAMTVAMGGNTIRAHTLGSSTGNALSVWPSLNVTNTAAFDTIDYAIFAARNYGLRLVIPLCDDYRYYHGGLYDFIGWRGFNTSAPNAYQLFFNTSSIVNDFKLYVNTILTRVNSYTGVAYKDDPTILAWETGNEYGAYNLKEGAPALAWTNNISKYIKSIAPNQLVIDGTNGVYYPGTNVTVPGLNATKVDMMTDHFYPVNNRTAIQDWKYSNASSKNLLFGEFDWTATNTTLTSFINTVEKNTTNAGDLLWSLFGHDDKCCQYVNHDDGYSLYYPNGNTPTLQQNVLLIAQHWHRMTGRTPPTKLAAVKCPQPELVK